MPKMLITCILSMPSPTLGSSVSRLLSNAQLKLAQTDCLVVIGVLGLDDLLSLAEKVSAFVLTVIIGIGLRAALLGGSGGRSVLLALGSGLRLGRGVCVLLVRDDSSSCRNVWTHWVQWQDCCLHRR
jgi:uncharacterized membrane protein YfcA